MKRLPALLIAAALLLAGCSAGKDAVDQSGGSAYQFKTATKVGTTIPANDRKPAGQFSAPLLDGGTYNLASDKGEVTVLNFWASWCAPCKIEMPGFDALYRQLKTKGVTFVGIDTKDTSQSSAKSFVQANDISYPIVSDEAGESILKLGKHIPAGSLPFTVVLDKQQRVAAVYIASMTSADLQPVLTSLAAESG